jgi:hypothetical protein
MVTLLPHHLPRLIGFTSANRVDMDAFQQQAAWGIGGSAARVSGKGIQAGSDQFVDQMKSLSQGPAGYISGPRSGSDGGATSEMDSTLRATTDSEPREGEG